MMCAIASFHRHNARWHLPKERQNICEAQLAVEQRGSACISAMSLKNRLGQIKSSNVCLVHPSRSLFAAAQAQSLASRVKVRRSFHIIKPGAIQRDIFLTWNKGNRNSVLRGSE